MDWYAGHIVMCLELKDDPQDVFMVYENIVLIGAESSEEALLKAEAQGQSEADLLDDSTTLDGKPARWIYKGVRKVVSCVCYPREQRPVSGDELTYNTYYLKSLDEVAKLARGESVSLEYDDA